MQVNNFECDKFSETEVVVYVTPRQLAQNNYRVYFTVAELEYMLGLLSVRVTKPKTYEQLVTAIKRITYDFIAHRPPTTPSISFQYGGHLDGKDRVFVTPSWGKNLLTRCQTNRLLSEVQELLVSDLDCQLHYMRGADDYVLIVTDK